MLQSGLIDLHCHLLPGVDDGCGTVEESLACVRVLIDHGFAGSVCTPHIWSSAYPGNTPKGIAAGVAKLQQHLAAAGVEYQLWPGGELRIADDTLDWLQRNGVPTLGPSRSVLIDYWGAEWPSYADAVVDHLLQENYQPILAHPERMDLDDQAWESLLRRLQQRGVWLQGNLKCIAGREGARVGQRALRLLSEDRYHVIATDLHGTRDLDDRLAGLSVVEQRLGERKFGELLAERPQTIVAGK